MITNRINEIQWLTPAIIEALKNRLTVAFDVDCKGFYILLFDEVEPMYKTIYKVTTTLNETKFINAEQFNAYCKKIFGSIGHNFADRRAQLEAYSGWEIIDWSLDDIEEETAYQAVYKAGHAKQYCLAIGVVSTSKELLTCDLTRAGILLSDVDIVPVPPQEEE